MIATIESDYGCDDALEISGLVTKGNMAIYQSFDGHIEYVLKVFPLLENLPLVIFQIIQ